MNRKLVSNKFIAVKQTAQTPMTPVKKEVSKSPTISNEEVKNHRFNKLAADQQKTISYISKVEFDLVTEQNALHKIIKTNNEKVL